MTASIADRLGQALSEFGPQKGIFPQGPPLDDTVRMSFKEAGAWARIQGAFGEGCQLIVARELMDRRTPEPGLHLQISHFGSKPVIEEATVVLGAMTGHVSLSIGHERSLVVFGPRCRGHFDVRLWREARLLVGEGTTCNGARIVVDNALVAIGSDGLLSDEILIQSSDQHGIVDLAANRIVNDIPNRTIIERHVWIGRRAVLMPNIRIGEGSVIGACALVTRDIPAKVIAAGAPAVVLKSGHTWSRWPDRYDPLTQAFIQDHHREAPEAPASSAPAFESAAFARTV